MTQIAAPITIEVLGPDAALVNGRPVGRGDHPTIVDAALAECIQTATRAHEQLAVRTLDPVHGEQWFQVAADGSVAALPLVLPARSPGIAVTPPPPLVLGSPSFASGVPAPRDAPRRDWDDWRRAPAPDPVNAAPPSQDDTETPADGSLNGTSGPAVTDPEATDPGPARLPYGAHAQEGLMPPPGYGLAAPATGYPQSNGYPVQETPAATDGQPLPVAAADYPPPPDYQTPAPAHPAPTLTDLLAGRPRPSSGPATRGWRAAARRLSGGVLNLAPGPAEQAERQAMIAVQRPLAGPRTVVVLNTKGGGGKTTATFCLAATFGTARGGYVLAWDDNETRGTLGWRARQASHRNTAVGLLHDLERFDGNGQARVGDLDAYVRAQADGQFDILASDEDAASAASIDAAAFKALHRVLCRFYRLLVIDTGNNLKASNWQAAVEAADQLIIVSSIREDTAGGAAWTLDSLMETGYQDKVSRAVTVLSSPTRTPDRALADRFHDHFGRRTRAVIEVPYDPALVDGGPIDLSALTPSTRSAWLTVAATVADGL